MRYKQQGAEMESTDWNMAVDFLKHIGEDKREIHNAISEGYVAGALRRIMALLAAVKPIFEDRLKNFSYEERYSSSIKRVQVALQPQNTGVRSVDSGIRRLSYEQSDNLLLELYHKLMYDLYKAKLVFGEDSHKTWQQEFKEDF